MKQHALAYARDSFDVFPVAVTKAPLTEHGFKDATTDPAQIRKWWSRHPDANIGVRCDWFFVVDVDPRDGGHHVLSGWKNVRGPMPHTWTARTGSGGLHIYFEHDEELGHIPLGRLHRGVDIKGGGRGYVLLPPSRNKRGEYRWLVSPHEATLARAPRWLIQEIVSVKKVEPPAPLRPRRRHRENADAFERARRYAAKIDPAVSGQRGHDATLSAAVKIARGFALSEDEALEVLVVEWNPRCEPPWSEKDLRRKVREALRIGRMDMGALLDRGAA